MCNLFSCPVTTNYIFVNVTREGSWVKCYSSNCTRRGATGPLRCSWNGCGPRCCGALCVFFLSKSSCSSLFHLRLSRKCYSLKLIFSNANQVNEFKIGLSNIEFIYYSLKRSTPKRYKTAAQKSFYHWTITFLGSIFILYSIFTSVWCSTGTKVHRNILFT
jgi:hypothetical protein